MQAYSLGRAVLCILLAIGGGLAAAALAGDETKPLVSLDQGWDASTQSRFYHETQGTRFMPAAMLEALQSVSGVPFLAPANMRRFGFIFDAVHHAPNGTPQDWPIGFAVDRDQSTGVAWAGFTCAACHTAQVQYHGKEFRIDGAPANIDVAAFRRALAEAVIATGKDPVRRARFEQRATALGFPGSRIAAAFDATLKTMLHGAQTPPDYVVASTPGGPGRLDALSAIGTAIFSTDLGVPGNAKKGLAPVDFPYLWDIWRFDWVQYNASVRQPMDRNVGEALGVGLQTNFIDPATGQVNPEPLRWKTTARIKNLYWMEDALTRLAPPRWPQAILGKVDGAEADRGHALFVMNCAACHAVQPIAGTSPTEWHVPVIPLAKIGTDPNQAVSYAANTFDAAKLGLGPAVHTPVGLGFVVARVKRQAYLDAGIPQSEWPKYDGFGREGNVFPAPCGYKARPLVGVWATGPFLHNGSVPTIFDLLSDTRPATFWFGSREFDPKKLGFVQSSGPGTMLFDSALPGNSNAGHWFTNDRARAGRIGPALTDTDKYAIIEYLKSATFASYPTRTISKAAPIPCENNPTWADHFS